MQASVFTLLRVADPRSVQIRKLPDSLTLTDPARHVVDVPALFERRRLLFLSGEVSRLVFALLFVLACNSVVFAQTTNELAQPEAGFYFAGMKSYGRAPTFLMMTGYEQVRSIVADIAGDREAARRVELVLPETGVCSGPRIASNEEAGCCGGPALADTTACCKADETAKAQGQGGCGCS